MTQSPATSTRVTTAAMREAAGALLAALGPEQRAAATAPFDTPDHREWTYLPGPRAGLSLREMDDAQRELAMRLLATGLSERGLATARDVMALEQVLGDLERGVGRPGWERRHPGHFWVRVLGTPDARAPWAWRVNGHHLAVHLTLVGDEVAGTPQFFGANPAVVPHEGHVDGEVVAVDPPGPRRPRVRGPEHPHPEVPGVPARPAGRHPSRGAGRATRCGRGWRRPGRCRTPAGRSGG